MFVLNFAPAVPERVPAPVALPFEGRGWMRERPSRRPRVPALGPTPPRLSRRAFHTPERRSRPLGDPRRAAPPRGRCSASAERETAGCVPFKSRERRATAPPPPPSPPESSPRRAAPGLRCARRSASHTPPGIGSRRRTSAATGSAADPNDLAASASRITGGCEAPARRRPHAGWSARPCAPLRRGLGCPGRARAEDRRAERRGAGSRARAPRCRSPTARTRGPATRRSTCERTPGWPQSAPQLGPGARRAREERGHPPWRPGTRLASPENAPEDAGAPEPRGFQLASANGGALE